MEEAVMFHPDGDVVGSTSGDGRFERLRARRELR
jgi:hypothetical protein